MGLKALTFSAIEKLKTALGDLAIPLVLSIRDVQPYVPGQKVTYASSNHDCLGVITKYRYDEIDGTMIKAEDALIILFPPISKVIPKQNDIVVNGAIQFRIIQNNPMYAGSEIAFNLVQGRPINAV